MSVAEALFKGRKLAIATKHRKERVIAPLLEKAIGVGCITPPHLDTDLLGTFTGDIERPGDPLHTARKKCEMAMQLTGTDLAVASEGSFGPHPYIPFIQADDEFLVFVDRKNNIEIIAREISTETNFNSIETDDVSELLRFADNAGFPDHALIIRKSPDSNEHIYKGIQSENELKAKFLFLKQQFGKVHVETDMRAMYNPTRMSVIEKTIQKLLSLINSTCPVCEHPGFSVVETKPGLPCSDCGFPTRSTLSHIYECKKCSYTEEHYHPHSKDVEEPTYCDHCNP